MHFGTTKMIGKMRFEQNLYFKKGGETVDKFAGVGLINIIIIWLCCMVLSIMAKTIVLKYNVPESVQAVVTAA